MDSRLACWLVDSVFCIERYTKENAAPGQALVPFPVEPIYLSLMSDIFILIVATFDKDI